MYLFHTMTWIVECFRPRLRGTNLKHYEDFKMTDVNQKVSVPDYGELILNFLAKCMQEQKNLQFPSPITGN